MSEEQFDLARTFDVIVAGAGPAGCVIASRLSEHGGKHVLLIEAGPDLVAGEEHPDILDPFALCASLQTEFHWPELLADAEPVGSTQSPRKPLPFIQARCVGGASNINGMGVDRGLPGDYEEWQRLGAAGWSWKDVLPYFRKLERELDFLNDPSMHGYDGPMPVRRLPQSRWAPFAAAVGEALQHRGLPLLEDYNADFRDGVGSTPTNCAPTGRVSASMAYLTKEVRRRPNLEILAHARVDHVSIEGGRANGVFVHADGATRLVRGRRVIICCGALQSPALLMRSGIGPAKHLASHGIGIVRDMPGVGANLQNHPSLRLVTYLPRSSAQAPDNPTLLQNWARFSSNHPGCEQSDMHLLMFNRHAWHGLGSRIGSIAVSVLNAYSKGSVELTGADPAAAPKVRFNLMADRRDEERMVIGTRFALELLVDPDVEKMRHELFFPNPRIVANLSRRSAWNGLKARAITWILDRGPLRELLLAGSSISAEKLLANEAALRDFVLQHARFQLHVCGTCRMGRPDDPDAVVDSAGQVHGIQALHVADASIFPTVPRGYTHFIVIMAAEKLADAVEADWNG